MGRIVEIKRFEIHDGDGIRTTLFLKGCPLRCKWCHNPECISNLPETAYLRSKCIGCGECTKLCNANTIDGAGHHFNRKFCTRCGKCVKVCPTEALKYYGLERKIDELIPQLLEDMLFYNVSGGGVTISGGEPLFQPVFTAGLLKELKKNGINTAVDTCGFAPREALDKVLPYTDTFLYDIKAIDEELHVGYTGQSNKIILDNLNYINQTGKSIEVRIPYLRSVNDNQIEKIGKFLCGMEMVKTVKVLPYHHFSINKYDALGMKYGLSDITLPDRHMVNSAVDCLRSFGIHAENGGDK